MIFLVETLRRPNECERRFVGFSAMASQVAPVRLTAEVYGVFHSDRSGTETHLVASRLEPGKGALPAGVLARQLEERFKKHLREKSRV